MAYLYRSARRGSSVDEDQNRRLSALEGLVAGEPKAGWQAFGPTISAGTSTQWRGWPSLTAYGAATPIHVAPQNVGYSRGGFSRDYMGQTAPYYTPIPGQELSVPVPGAFTTLGAIDHTGAAYVQGWTDQPPLHMVLENYDHVNGALITAGAPAPLVDRQYSHDMYGELMFQTYWPPRHDSQTQTNNLLRKINTNRVRVALIEVDLHKEIELLSVGGWGGGFTYDFAPGSCPSVSDLFVSPSFCNRGIQFYPANSPQRMMELCHCPETITSAWRQSVDLDDPELLPSTVEDPATLYAGAGSFPQRLSALGMRHIQRDKTRRQFRVLKDEVFTLAKPQDDVDDVNVRGGISNVTYSVDKIPFHWPIHRTDVYPYLIEHTNSTPGADPELIHVPSRYVRYLVMFAEWSPYRRSPVSVENLSYLVTSKPGDLFILNNNHNATLNPAQPQPPGGISAQTDNTIGAGGVVLGSRFDVGLSAAGTNVPFTLVQWDIILNGATVPKTAADAMDETPKKADLVSVGSIGRDRRDASGIDQLQFSKQPKVGVPAEGTYGLESGKRHFGESVRNAFGSLSSADMMRAARIAAEVARAAGVGGAAGQLVVAGGQAAQWWQQVD